MAFNLIQQGAEARLYEGSFQGRDMILKERFTKAYRHLELDEKLTKERLRAELRGIMRTKSIGIRTPAIYFVDPKTSTIYMEKISNALTVNVFIGKLLKACISGDCDVECTARLKSLAAEIGSTIGRIHGAGIIHGDLTTSNILIITNESSELIPEIHIALIDFGLSHVDNSPEDKGVDLYVLERALISTHSSIPWFFDHLIQSYKVSNLSDGPEVIQKFEEVRLRGRKRDMVG